MKRILALGAAVVLGLGFVSAPVQAAAPSAGADQVVNPDGKVVTKLPALETVKTRPASLNERAVTKGMPGIVERATPKGNPNAKTSSKRVTALADPACSTGVYGACYFYNGGIQTGFTANYGASATVKIGGHSGALNGATDYHTLVEAAVQSADSKQIVEVGVTQDPGVNKNASVGWYGPRAFVGAWVNGVFQGYNGGGFVPVSGAAIVPGVTNLSANTNYVFHIWYETSTDRWWIGLGSAWMGYFPGTLWSSAPVDPVTFNRNEKTQIFWEIASTEEKPCSDLGNGQIPTATAGVGSQVSDIKFRGLANGAITSNVNFSTYRVADPSPAANVSSPYANTYSLGPAGAQNAYKGGGPMWNAAGTGVGSLGQPC